MKEFLIRLVISQRIRALREFPRFLGTSEHYTCSVYIGLDKKLRILNAPVHMALSSKVYHSVYVIFRKDL